MSTEAKNEAATSQKEAIQQGQRLLLPIELDALTRKRQELIDRQSELGALLGAAMNESAETSHDNGPADAINNDAMVVGAEHETLLRVLRIAIPIEYPKEVDKVRIGSIVSIRHGIEDASEKYLLTGYTRQVELAGLYDGEIAALSAPTPLGLALLGSSVGDEVIFEASGRKFSVQVTNIEATSGNRPTVRNSEITLFARNTDPIQDVGYVMVRPDGFEQRIDEDIAARIDKSGLTIVKRKISVLTDEQVNNIYPHLHEKPFFKDMKSSIVGRRVLSFIVSGPANVGEKLLAIKGSSLDVQGSVRGDYSLGHLLEGDLHEAYVDGTFNDDQLADPRISEVLRNDRIHTDETTQEALNSIGVMFSDEELAEAVKRYPNLKTLLLS